MNDGWLPGDGRFVDVQEIGRGSSGIVYGALDIARGTRVAIKRVVAVADPGALEREFRVAAALDHPSIVRPYDLVFLDEAGALLTMELVRGGSLDATIQSAPERWRVALTAAIDVLAGLDYLHRQGLVHGDVKGANVLIDEESGHAKLVDFGLADLAGTGAVCGTAAFLAPEVVSGQVRGPAADLYALGVTLYAGVVGSNPFEGSTLAETFQRQLHLRPATLVELGRAPPSVSAFIDNLMDKDPAVRPRTAGHALAAARMLASTENVDIGAVLDVLQPPLIGRDAALLGLEEVLRQGLPVVRIGGAHGAGRSRLVRELQVRLQLRGGRCALFSVYGLDACGVLDAVWSAFGDTHRTPPVWSPDGSIDLARSIAPLRTAWKGKQQVLIMDDVDTAGPPARAVVESLASALPAGSQLILVTDVGDITWRVSPLDETEITLLAAAALGAPLGDLLGQELYRASAGFPVVALELLRSAARGRRIRRRHERIEALVHPPFPDNPGETDDLLGQLAAERLRALSPKHRSSLAVLFVLGQDATPARAESSLGDELARLLTLGAVALAAGRIEPSPRRLGRLAFDGLTQSEQADISRLAADTLAQESSGSTAGRLVAHRLAAGQPDVALVEAHAAAYLAESTGDCAVALSALRAVEANDLAAARPGSLATHELLARLAHRAGLYEESCKRLAELPHTSPDGLEHRRMLVEGMARLGRMEAALKLADELEQASLEAPAVPAARIQLMSAEARRLAGQFGAAHASISGALSAADGLPPALLASLHREAATIAWHQSQLDTALVHGEAALLASRGADDALAVAMCSLVIGTVHRMAGRYRVALEHYREAAIGFEQAGAVAQLGKCLNNVGVCFYLLGDIEQAIVQWEDAVSCADRSGEIAEKLALLNNVGYLHLERGNFDRAEPAFVEALDLAEKSRAERNLVQILGNLGELFARTNRAEDALLQLEEAARRARNLGVPPDAVESERRLAELLLSKGANAEVLALCDRLIPEALGLGLAVESSHLERVAGLARLRTGGRAAALEHLERAAAAAGRDVHSLESGLTTLACAEVALEGGDAKAAVSGALEAERCFKLRSASWHVSQARAFLDRMRALAPAEPAPGPGRLIADAAAFANASESLEAIVRDIAHRTLLATQGHRCAVVVSRFAELQGVSVMLARDPCGTTGTWGGVADAYSHTVAGRVSRTGNLFCTSNLPADPDFSSAMSVLNFDLRSVACVPIRVEGAAAGVVYVDSRAFVGDAFEVALPTLEAMAAILAQAIERMRWRRRYELQVEALAYATHELRSPLTAIAGFAALVQSDGTQAPDEADVRELVQVARGECARMNRMLVDLKTYSDTQFARPTVLETISASIIVLRAFACARTVAAEKGVLLRDATGPNETLVHVDAASLQQVLVNLVNNAVRYSPIGGRVVISSRLEAVPEILGERPMVRISVADQGPGVAPSERERVFEKFQRGSGARGPGTGLGLSIARSIVNAHGGALWIESQPGPGCRFSFTVPLAE